MLSLGDAKKIHWLGASIYKFIVYSVSWFNVLNQDLNFNSHSYVFQYTCKFITFYWHISQVTGQIYPFLLGLSACVQGTFNWHSSLLIISSATTSIFWINSTVEQKLTSGFTWSPPNKEMVILHINERFMKRIVFVLNLLRRIHNHTHVRAK